MENESETAERGGSDSCDINIEQDAASEKFPRCWGMTWLYAG